MEAADWPQLMNCRCCVVLLRPDRRHHAAGLLQLPVQRRERRHPSGEAGPVRGHELPSVALLCQLVAQHVPDRCAQVS